jgi:hypothetical protein
VGSLTSHNTTGLLGLLRGWLLTGFIWHFLLRFLWLQFNLRRSRQFSITVYRLTLYLTLWSSLHALTPLGLLPLTSARVPFSNGGRYPSWVPQLSSSHGHSDSWLIVHSLTAHTYRSDGRFWQVDLCYTVVRRKSESLRLVSKRSDAVLPTLQLRRWGNRITVISKLCASPTCRLLVSLSLSLSLSCFSLQTRLVRSIDSISWADSEGHRPRIIAAPLTQLPTSNFGCQFQSSLLQLELCRIKDFHRSSVQ